MKKPVRILLTVGLVAAVAARLVWCTPRTFGRGTDAARVDHINVFDGTTGTGFTVTDPEDISYIVENIQSHPVRPAKLSLGYIGYRFSLVYVDENDKAIVPSSTSTGKIPSARTPSSTAATEACAWIFSRSWKKNTHNPDLFPANIVQNGGAFPWNPSGINYMKLQKAP